MCSRLGKDNEVLWCIGCCDGISLSETNKVKYTQAQVQVLVNIITKPQRMFVAIDKVSKHFLVSCQKAFSCCVFLVWLIVVHSIVLFLEYIKFETNWERDIQLWLPLLIDFLVQSWSR